MLPALYFQLTCPSNCSHLFINDSRFIINIPAEELASVERILFQIEQAHWFYEDFVREQNTSLPSFSLKNFSAKYILFRVVL